MNSLVIVNLAITKKLLQLIMCIHHLVFGKCIFGKDYWKYNCCSEGKTYIILLANQIKSNINLPCFSNQKEVNKTYNCENLGLSEIPDTLPNTTEFLEFSFNFLPTIHNGTFNRLVNLTFLDLTRYVSELYVCS